MFAFLIRKQENGSQNVSTQWMCFLHGRQSRWAQQPSAVNKASFPCWNEISRNQMRCVAREVRWCWFSFMRAKLFVINFRWLSEFQSNDCSQHTRMMFLYIFNPYNASGSSLWGSEQLTCNVTSSPMFRLCCFGPFGKGPKQLGKLLWLCSTL